METADRLNRIKDRLITGDRDGLVEQVRQTLDEGIPTQTILDDGLIAGMTEVGRRYRHDDIFLPDVLLSARAMKAGMALLEPYLAAGQIEYTGTVILGTVRGDRHDIGKNLVGIMLQGAGFKVVDLGTEVSPQAFVAAASDHQADLVALSMLLSTTAPAVAEVIAAIRNAELPTTRIMAGGAALTEEAAKRMGIDGYAQDAASAVEVARSLLDKNN